jgi:hypothetical protein
LQSQRERRGAEEEKERDGDGDGDGQRSNLSPSTAPLGISSLPLPNSATGPQRAAEAAATQHIHYPHGHEGGRRKARGVCRRLGCWPECKPQVQGCNRSAGADEEKSLTVLQQSIRVR